MTTEAEAVSLPPAEAIRYFGGQVNLPTQRWTDVWKAGHTRAFVVAGLQADDLLAEIRKARDKALAEGTTLAEFRRDLAPLLARTGWESKGRGYVAWRTRLIYETNLRSAYAAGQYEQQTDPDVLALVPIWRYRHSGAKDPRPEHLAWDGLTLRHDDAWWSTHYPPNGWGCGCWVEPMTERAAAREGGTRGRDSTGLNQAPPILRRPWTDPASGRTEQVPIGIDPGWDYNVGAAWRSNRDLPTPSTPVPPDAAPPAPALPRAQPAAMRTEVRRGAASTATTRLDATLRQDYAAWTGSLSADERAAVQLYRSSAGLAMNRVLRGERPRLPALSASIDLVLQALGRAVAARAVTVRRGASAAELAEIGEVGSAGTFRQIVSASIDQAIAAGFAQRRGGRVVEIRVPAGARGAAYVQLSPTDRPVQYEMLLAPGTRYRVISRTGRRIVVEILDVAASDRADR